MTFGQGKNDYRCLYIKKNVRVQALVSSGATRVCESQLAGEKVIIAIALSYDFRFNLTDYSTLEYHLTEGKVNCIIDQRE